MAYKSLQALAVFVVLVGILWNIPATQAMLVSVWMPRFAGCTITQTARDANIAAARRTIESNAAKALRRIARDQDGYTLWETPFGRMWMAVDDPTALAQLVSERQRRAYPACKPGEIVLDCGANIGAYSREALEAGAKLVVAIEPAPRNLEALRRNLEPEVKAGRAIIYPKGVWDRDATLRLSQAGDSIEDSVVLSRGHDGPTVPLTTIDKLVAELRLARVDSIKLDIEGAERHALKGAGDTIRAYRPRLIVASYHLPDDPEAILQSVADTRVDYRLACRYCANWFGRSRIVPEIMVLE